MDSFVKGDATFSLGAKGLLHDRKHAPETGDGNSHGAEFTKNFVPALDGDSLLMKGYRCKDFGETVDTMLGQLDRHLDGVNDPSQNGLQCGPITVTFEELFDGDGLLAVLGILGIERSKDRVDSVEEDAANSGELVTVALSASDEIVHKHVHEGCAAGARASKRRVALQRYIDCCCR